MNMENRVTQQDEISLKELIQVIWNGKILIAVITMVALALSAFYTFVIASPSYESSVLLNVSFRDPVVTPYGEYPNPFKNMDEYTSLATRPETLGKTSAQLDTISYNQIRDSISVSKVQGTTNLFRLTATASSPEKAYDIASFHAQSYLRQLNHTLVVDFSNTLSVQITKDTKDLEGNEIDLNNTLQLLADTEKAITLKNALISQEEYAMIAAGGTLDLDRIKGDILLTQEPNPLYLKFLEQIADIKIQCSILERKIEQATKNLEELKAERESLEQTMNYADDQSISNLVTIISHPEVEGQKIGPRHTFNLAIGLVLGLMLGVFVTLFKAYWEEVI